MFILGLDYTEDPNPHSWEGADFYDTYAEAEAAGELATRESFDYGYTVVDVSGMGLHHIPTHRPVAAIRELRRLIVEELAGDAPPDDNEALNIVRLLHAAGAVLLVAAEELEKGGSV